MVRLFLSRLVQTAQVLLLSSIIVFTVIRLVPGDPAVVELGPQAEDPRYREHLEAKRRELGLDKPVPVQNVLWLGRVATGNLGVSARNKEPVVSLILERLPATVTLVVGGAAIAVTMALILGIASALRRNTIVDGLVRLLTLAGVAMPPFWLGLLLILAFDVNLRWLPVSRFHADLGRSSPGIASLGAASLEPRRLHDGLFHPGSFGLRCWRRCRRTTFGPLGGRGFAHGRSSAATFYATPCCRSSP